MSTGCSATCFPEPNANVPPPPNLNAIWTPNRAQVLVTNTQLANQTDLLAKFATGPCRSHGRGRLRHHPRDARLPAQPVRRPGRDQLPRSGSVALRRRSAAADREPVDLRRGDRRRRLHRRSGQDHQVFRGAGQHRATTSTTSRRMRRWPLAGDPTSRARRRDVRAGASAAVFHPTENSSVYVMRGTSFNPSADNLSISVTTPRGRAQPARLSPPEADADHRSRRQGRGAQRQAHAADRRFRHRENQSARARSGQLIGDHHWTAP